MAKDKNPFDLKTLTDALAYCSSSFECGRVDLPLPSKANNLNRFKVKLFGRYRCLSKL